MKEALSEFHESHFLISILNVLHWSHSRGGLSYAIVWCSFSSIYNSTSSLSWMPSLFSSFPLHFYANISSWIYFGSISQKSKVPLLLGRSWGIHKGQKGPKGSNKARWNALGNWTWLTHLPKRDSFNTSYTQLCSARQNLSSILNEITGNLMLSCFKMSYK